MAETKTKSSKATAKAAPKAKAAKAKKAAGVETNLVRRVTARAKNTQIDAFRTGDTVNVSVKVKEGEKERVQLYKGIVTKIQGAGASKSFTVRKISAGVGVERTFPFSSPSIERVEALTKGHVRRSRLFYLRSLEGKAAKINSDLIATKTAETTPAAE